MASQASGNGTRRDHGDRRRTRDLRDARDRDDDRDRMIQTDWEDRDRPERRDEREWRGHDERPRERMSWDRDRDPWDRGDRSGVWDSAWDRRGDDMYAAGQSRREDLDEGRFEQRRAMDRGFARDRGGRIAGGYGRDEGDLRGGYGRGFGGPGYGRGTGFYGRERRPVSGPGYSHAGRVTEGSRYAGQDEEWRGGNRGRGPQGYVRSEDRIREDVCEALTLDDHVDATDIHVVVRGGEVSLSGTVPERYMKRLAEDIVEDVSGVTDIQNTIRVQAATQDVEGRGGRKG